ncbi:MAG: 2'-5' RNA ligase family protein [Gemmatimonadaceae bacterium]
MRESTQVRAVGACGIKVERVEAPHITLRRIGARRAILLQRMARGKEDASIAVHKVAAGRLAAAIRYTPNA